MKINYRLIWLLAALSAIAMAALLSCSGVSEPGLREAENVSASDESEKPAGPPPLVVTENAPLLLDEPDQTEKPQPGAAAKVLTDNGPCFVCHANYAEELLASQHAAVGTGCVTCHGDSYAHRNDESNTTPPDVMYPADRIDAACQKCHGSHDVPATKVIALWLKRCPDKTRPETIVCTDCHGEHRLKVRTVRWDKRTGKLMI
jgi:hypothetical protein